MVINFILPPEASAKRQNTSTLGDVYKRQVWGGLVNPKLAVALTGRRGEALEEYKKVILALNNKVVEEAPADLTIRCV